MKTFDLSGMRCPMPIVELNRIITAMSDDEQFTVTADDPAFALDVAAWCRRTGHELVDSDTGSGQTVAVVQVRKKTPCSSDQ